MRLGFATFFLSFLFSTVALAATPYDQVKTRLATVVANNPDVSKIVIGINDQGVEIEGVKIGNGSGPTFLVVGAHHGNEEKSAEVALNFINQVLAKKKRVRNRFLSEATFHVIPVLNISGYNNDQREERNASGRSFDPNRDYPDPCGNDSTFNLASTDALAKYMIAEDVVGAVTIHGYIGTFTYPWGTYTNQTATPDNNIFQTMVSDAARTNNHYRTGTHADIIYPTVGAFEDWAYHALGVWVALLEIKNNPNYSLDAKTILSYFEHTPTQKSAFHEHLGTCRHMDEEAIILSRP